MHALEKTQKPIAGIVSCGQVIFDLNCSVKIVRFRYLRSVRTKNSYIFGEISGFHTGVFEGECLLGYYVV